MAPYPVAWQERTNKKNIACSRPIGDEALFILSVSYIRKTQIMSDSPPTENQHRAQQCFVFSSFSSSWSRTASFLVVVFKQLLGISQLFFIEHFMEPGIIERKVWSTERKETYKSNGLPNFRLFKKRWVIQKFSYQDVNENNEKYLKSLLNLSAKFLVAIRYILEPFLATRKFFIVSISALSKQNWTLTPNHSLGLVPAKDIMCLKQIPLTLICRADDF